VIVSRRRATLLMRLWRWPVERFDVLKWIREVRDRHHDERKGLPLNERIRRTEEAAERFRQSRRTATASDEPQD